MNLLREEGTLTTHIDNTSVSSSRNDSVASLVDGSNQVETLVIMTVIIVVGSRGFIRHLSPLGIAFRKCYILHFAI